jgi:hypothetical protein
MSKQTALQWLEQEFDKLEYVIGVHSVMYELIDKAKQMEKEQIVDATVQVMMKQLNICSESGIIQLVNNAEHYYNETYGGQDEK